MFEQNVQFKISHVTEKSLENALDPSNYICPLFKADVSEVNSRILADATFKEKLYRFVIGNVVYANWEKFSKYFSCKSKLIWNWSTNCYQFVISQKITGSEKTKSKIKYGLNNSNFSKTSGYIYILVTINIESNQIILKENLYKIIINQRPVFAETVDSRLVSGLGSFILEKDKMQLSETFYNLTFSDLRKTLQNFNELLSDFEIQETDIFNCLNHFDQKYPKTCDCATIENSWKLAIHAFPLFQKASDVVQINLLQEAYYETSKESKNNGMIHAISEATFASKLYYQIMKNRLDNMIVIGRSVKFLTCQKWSRGYHNSIKPIILHSQSDFDNFDYQNISPNELVWVKYDDTTYLVYQMFKLITPKANSNNYEESEIINS